MRVTFSGAFIYSDGVFHRGNLTAGNSGEISFVDASSYHIFPGFTDVHVHFREPGFSYKETISAGSAAAAHGGFTTVCTMPNLEPAPDCLENLDIQTKIIDRDAKVRVLPYGTITRGELGREISDMEALAPHVCGFSDDGRGVDDTGLMREAMNRAASLGKIIAAHCEDGSCVKDSPEAEWHEIERNIKLCDETRCKLHICHISTEAGVSLVRDAKAAGVNVTCETAPHYLLFSERDAADDGRFRMNPPLRTENDRLALLVGLCDGTIDMIATDHAPHTAEEKSHGMKSLNGIVGLETAFPALYTGLVCRGVITLEKLVALMSEAPNRRFGFEPNGYCVYDLGKKYVVEPSSFFSLGRATPFDGMLLSGKCMAAVMNDKFVFKDADL